jgi:hypothetical protein
MNSKLFAFVSLVSLAGLSPASATTYYTYNYMGPDFTVVGGAYTTSDNVSGSVTLTQPLGDDFSGPISSILYAFSFSDGVQTISSSTPGVYLFPGEDNFETGLSGGITSWAFEMNITGAPPQSFIATTTGDDSVETDSGASGAFVLELGDWSYPATATPLPAALPLFATGLGALGLFGGRRKRKASDAIAAA